MTESDTGVTVQLKEQVEHTKAEGGDKLREQVDDKTTKAGRETRKIADAMRRTGEQLRTESGDGTATRVTSAVADRLERAGGYLESARGDDLLRDAERFARERPWMVALGSAAVGFLASRLLKASSDSRYAASQRTSTPRAGADWQQPYEPATSRSVRTTAPAYSTGGGS